MEVFLHTHPIKYPIWEELLECRHKTIVMSDVERLKIASDKMRLKILLMLQESKDKNYVSKMAQELKKERKTIYWHLKKLEEMGLVQGKYVLGIKKDKVPVTTREYSLTHKGKSILKVVLSVKP
jgi:DNA-binding transcriptional ArsR family regulator